MMSRRKRMWRNVLILLICVGFPVNLVAHLRQLNRHEQAFIAAVTFGDERQVRAELRWGREPEHAGRARTAAWMAGYFA